MFIPEEIWHGGFFELSIEVGERSDDRLLTAQNVIWDYQELDGCFTRRDVEPENQQRTTAASLGIETGTHCLGMATLSNQKRIACGTCVIRESDGPDWLDLYLPMGALNTAYDVGAYPFLTKADTYPQWVHEVEGWLADVAVWLAGQINYEMALIGHEVSGHCYAADLERDGNTVHWLHLARRWAIQVLSK